MSAASSPVSEVVIVGASLAGVSAAQALRENGHEGSIVLVGDEQHEPYDRPPLSKEFLAADDAEPSPLIGPDGLDVEWRLGVRATGLDVEGERPRVLLDDGTSLDADALVLATGASPRRLPGDELPGVHVLRTVDDARQLRESLRNATHLAVVGAGFIGSEIASAGRSRGLEVTVIEAAKDPLSGALGPRMAGRVVAEHERHGTELITGVGVDGFVGDERVSGVRLADGRVIEADVVVVGVGVLPTVEWLRESGVALDQGVLVDRHGRTNVESVWAAGDCTQTWDEATGEHRRSEHWTNALVQGAAVARSVLGVEPADEPVPYVWSDQYEQMIQLAGRIGPDEELRLIEGDLDQGPVVVVYEREGRPVGVLGIDSPRRFTRLRKALERGKPLE